MQGKSHDQTGLSQQASPDEVGIQDSYLWSFVSWS